MIKQTTLSVIILSFYKKLSIMSLNHIDLFWDVFDVVEKEGSSIYREYFGDFGSAFFMSILSGKPRHPTMVLISLPSHSYRYVF